MKKIVIIEVECEHNIIIRPNAIEIVLSINHRTQYYYTNEAYYRISLYIEIFPTGSPHRK